MNKQSIEAVWLHGNEVCYIEHLVEVSGLSMDEIKDLIESDVITPTDDTAQPYSFALHTVLTVKTARRLRDDLELDRNGLSIALTLLQRIDALEVEITKVRAELGRSI
jgi:chaperone modulatory protein CbpM